MIIYLDENMPPHLAKGFNVLQIPENFKSNLQIEVLYLSDVFSKGAKDIDWIPKVGKEGSCIITQDININRRKHELELYREFKVGMFFLRGKSKKQGMSIWEMVEALSKHWVEITKIASVDSRPFAYEFKLKGRKLKRLP